MAQLVTKQQEPMIHIVDDDPYLLKAIQWLMTSMKYCVKGYLSAREYLKEPIKNTLGCLIIDAKMPNMSGVQLHDFILQYTIKIPVIFISGDSNVPIAVERIKKGAVDFLTKPINNNQLIEAVNKALFISAHQLEKEETRKKSIRIINRLSSEEIQIMHLLLKGKNTKQIAQYVGLAPHSIKLHKTQILSKTDTESLIELAELAKNAQFTNDNLSMTFSETLR
ncbi:MAG: response regulator [Gammaproteobacteria bacterium]|nr:response regulator [Gammaproteobacteria bacterium]